MLCLGRSLAGLSPQGPKFDSRSSQCEISGGQSGTAKTSGKTKNKMGGRSPEGHTTDPRNTRMGKTSRRQRRIEASSEGDQAPEGAVAPYMEWKWNGK